MNRRTFIKTTGIGSIAPFSQVSDLSDPTILSGEVVDLNKDPVPKADIYVYSYAFTAARGQHNLVYEGQTKTDSRGNWSLSTDISPPSEREGPNAENPPGGTDKVKVVVLAKSNEWFDARNFVYHTGKDIKTKKTTNLLNKYFLLEQKFIGADPSTSSIEFTNKEDTHFGIVSVYREFSPNDTDFERVHVNLYNSTEVKIKPNKKKVVERDPLRFVSAGFTTALSEDIWIGDIPSDTSFGPGRAPPGSSVVLHTADDIVNEDQFLAQHTDFSLQGPLTPATAYSYLSKSFKPLSTAGPNDTQSILFGLGKFTATTVAENIGKGGKLSDARDATLILQSLAGLQSLFESSQNSDPVQEKLDRDNTLNKVINSDGNINTNLFDTTVFGFDSRSLIKKCG